MGNCIGLLFALQYFKYVKCPKCESKIYYDFSKRNIEKKNLLDGCKYCLSKIKSDKVIN